jgi:hypothetical protein
LLLKLVTSLCIYSAVFVRISSYQTITNQLKMQKSIYLLLVGCAVYTNAVETSSLRTKLKGLAQLEARGASHPAPAADLSVDFTDCNLTAPVLGDLDGDLLDWCPDTFGASSSSLGSALTAASQ